MSGLSIHTLRYYENVGLIRSVFRDEQSGHRRYDRETVARIESLSCLRACGLGLKEMQYALFLSEKSDSGSHQKKELFIAHAARVQGEIAKLQVRLSYLEGKVEYWEAVEQGDTARAGELASKNKELASKLIKERSE